MGHLLSESNFPSIVAISVLVRTPIASNSHVWVKVKCAVCVWQLSYLSSCGAVTSMLSVAHLHWCIVGDERWPSRAEFNYYKEVSPFLFLLSVFVLSSANWLSVTARKMLVRVWGSRGRVADAGRQAEQNQSNAQSGWETIHYRCPRRGPQHFSRLAAFGLKTPNNICEGNNMLTLLLCPVMSCSLYQPHIK